MTFVKRAQGSADRKLMAQINRIIFLASPIEDLASGDRGRQMARYLGRQIIRKQFHQHQQILSWENVQCVDIMSDVVSDRIIMIC